MRPKKTISSRIAPTGGTCRRPNGALGGTPCRSRKVEGEDQGEGGKSKDKGMDQFFYKGQGKGVGALEYPDQEPCWSEESWSAEDGARNPIGAVSKVKTRCIASGVPVEKVPNSIMHQKNTAMEWQPRKKSMRKMRTIAKDPNAGEKDETNMEKEEKEVGTMFAEKGWTVKMSRKRVKSQKVTKVLQLKDHLRAAPEKG